MFRGPITAADFRGQFSGHETFPLRHLWLRKAYDAVAPRPCTRALFAGQESIVTFGVGKNMALSIRYWALACGILEEDAEGIRVAALGEFLFGKSGRDLYMESLATTWLMQWQIASTPNVTTTWFWAFNHLNSQVFDAEFLSKSILDYCRVRDWKRVADKTVQRDVECFVRSYLPPKLERGAFGEEGLEPVLAELGLLRAGLGKQLEFRRGPKPTLPDGVFAYALHQFWERYAPSLSSLSVEAITYEPGSPGRVFKLDEASVVERLATVADLTGGVIVWSDTAGVRQVMRSGPLGSPLELLEGAYGARTHLRKVA